jgi:hypothetical protein
MVPAITSHSHVADTHRLLVKLAPPPALEDAHRYAELLRRSDHPLCCIEPSFVHGIERSRVSPPGWPLAVRAADAVVRNLIISDVKFVQEVLVHGSNPNILINRAHITPSL